MIMKKILSVLALLTICFGLSACGNSERENSRNEINSSSSKSKESYVGRYISWKDGAGIELNSDGTGRYVYYDKVNTNTDDKLTWKVSRKGVVEIRLDDPDVKGAIMGTLTSDDEIILTGNSGWQTEKLRKITSGMSLDEFLKSMAYDDETHADDDSEVENNGAEKKNDKPNIDKPSDKGDNDVNNDDYLGSSSIVSDQSSINTPPLRSDKISQRSPDTQISN